MSSRRPRPGPRNDGSVGERLLAALHARQLDLRYQPEVDMRTGQLLAVEALVRWNDPERGQLLPDDFIGVAEQSGLIARLGDWVIEQAIADLATWVGAAAASTTKHDMPLLRINVSPAQLTHSDVVGHLAAALQRHRVPASSVCVEFTETAPIDDKVLARTVDALHELGVVSAIDDLATGYSTLARLRTLPVDGVKLDRELVVGIATDPRARAIVEGLLITARELGADVVAEGVESDADAQTLIELGCFRGQGHLFGRAEDRQSIADRWKA